MTKYLLIGIAIILIAFSGYFYYSQQEIAGLNRHVAKLETINKTNEETITELTSNIKQNEQATLDLQKRLQEAEEYSDSLLKKLRKINLKKLSLERSSETQTKINNATTKLFRELEQETGARNETK